MDIIESIKGTIFKLCIAFFSLCTLLWFSVFSYGTLYYLYIPAVAHTIAVHLQYDMSCIKGRVCHTIDTIDLRSQYPAMPPPGKCHTIFPSNNITLIESGTEFLRGGQGYAIELVLEMPESEHNQNQGMFMIKLDMINNYGRVIKSSRRPALLHYRSYLFKTIYTLFSMPGLLAGSLEEKQSLTIPLFEKYVEESFDPAHFAYVEVQAPSIEIYSSTLRIHAQFTGLRYLMYYWPVLSAIIGIGGHFLFLVVTIGLIWLYETAENPISDEMNVRQSESLLQITRRKTKKQNEAGFQFNERERENVDIETLSTHTAPAVNQMVDDTDEEYFDSYDLMCHQLKL